MLTEEERINVIENFQNGWKFHHWKECNQVSVLWANLWLEILKSFRRHFRDVLQFKCRTIKVDPRILINRVPMKMKRSENKHKTNLSIHKLRVIVEGRERIWRTQERTTTLFIYAVNMTTGFCVFSSRAFNTKWIFFGFTTWWKVSWQTNNGKLTSTLFKEKSNLT